jgi:acyl-CoA synthetase (NDP forming)
VFCLWVFRERGEGVGGAQLQDRLVKAAGDMPIIGPNCYGLLNYLDNVCLWPDVHGCVDIERGVALIGQSSNILINLSMQKRGLPVAYIIAAGNQAQTSVSDLGNALLADERVSVIGLYLEGFGDLREFEEFARNARKAGKPVVVIKAGHSEKSKKATMTHTASLAGNSAASSAFLKRLGITEVYSMEVFIETIKLLHFIGPLKGNQICSVSCSGGEASLMADISMKFDLEYPDLSTRQTTRLKELLGPIVTVSNPLDYHTFIWGDVPLMSDVFSAVMEGSFDLNVFVLDIPRQDRCDPSSYDCAIEAICIAKERTGAKVAVLGLLPENLPEHVISLFNSHGVLCLNGMDAGLAAIDRAYRAYQIITNANNSPVCMHPDLRKEITFDERQSKLKLAEFEVQIPSHVIGKNVDELIEKSRGNLHYPLALKISGIAHKSDVGGVALNITSQKQLEIEFDKLADADEYLLEEMVDEVIGELIIGVTRDQTGMLLLTLGAGGIYTELFDDSANLILPTSKDEILTALRGLKITKIFDGYRGGIKANLVNVTASIFSISQYACADTGLSELDVNPLLVCENTSIAADALICSSE